MREVSPMGGLLSQDERMDVLQMASTVTGHFAVGRLHW